MPVSNLRWLAIAVMFWLLASNGSHAQTTPEGLKFNSSSLRPGKFDIFFQKNETQNIYNAIWWSPALKGGAGIINNENSTDIKYLGAFISPFVGKPSLGTLILGGQIVDTNGLTHMEAQGEYRFPFGLGIGGGRVSRENSPMDISYFKMSLRNDKSILKYIAALQWQKLGQESSPGGYLALYGKNLMVVGGSDGEQWRTAFGYVSTVDKQNLFVPAGEVLYVDNSIGDIDGPKFIFANATLGFQGGFLSHPARLGRAMGPTGSEFGNPLGFLSPTFNRRLNIWELGSLVNFRVEYLDIKGGDDPQTWEAVLFPANFDQRKTVLDGLFIGAGYDNPGATDDTFRSILGYTTRIGGFKVGGHVVYDWTPENVSVFVGLIDLF